VPWFRPFIFEAIECNITIDRKRFQARVGERLAGTYTYPVRKRELYDRAFGLTVLPCQNGVRLTNYAPAVPLIYGNFRYMLPLYFSILIYKDHR